MIYEVRTYDLKPGGVHIFEEAFEKALPHREKYSKLGAFFHTEIGPLNQVIHIWPYDSLDQRNEVRAEAGKDPNWPPDSQGTILHMESEIFYPAPFMRPLGGGQKQGNVYEMRIYEYQNGAMPKVLDIWSAAIEHREKFSPLAAGMYSDIGGLNKWVHIWPYEDLATRDRIRAEASATPHWPPPTREFLVNQETKILIPASFSPQA